jgi:hypothetical protein
MTASDTDDAPYATPINATASAVGPRRRPAWGWWVLRFWVTAQAVDAFLQPVFEGRFLSGDFGMLAMHRTNGTYVGVVSVSQVVVAVAAWWVSRVPMKVVLTVVALGAAAGLQIYLGFSRDLGLHIPLGVAIIAVSGGLAVWMWTNRPTSGGRS